MEGKYSQLNFSIKKYSIIGTVLCLLFIVNSNVVFATPTDPNLNYYSDPPFEVERYNTSEVIEKAIELGYAIKIESFPGGCKNTTPDGGCKGKDWIPPTYEYINVNDTYSFLNASRRLGVNNQGNVGLHVSLNELEFGAEPKDILGDPYLFIAGFKTFDPNVTIEEANDIIVEELKTLGILNRDIKINFHSFYPPELAGGQGNPGDLGILSYLIGIIILIFAMILIIQKYGGGKK